MADGWIPVVQEALKLPGLLCEVYGDLAKPGVRQVGKALDTVLGLGNTILWPITLANEKSRMSLEKNLEAYRTKLEIVSEEKIVEVPPEVGVPIAEKLTYIRDQGLADLYVNLLAKASIIETANQAHPSFVNVINNLSPDEAKFIQYFVDLENLIFLAAKWVDKSTGIYNIAGDLLLSPARTESLTFPENIAAYLSNLSGLGLIAIHHDRFTAGDDAFANYDALELYWKDALPSVNINYPERELVITRGVISSTEYGRLFFLACHQQ